jgi:hypothetical protein
MAVPSKPDYHYPYRLFSQRLWRYVRTRSPGGGERGLLRDERLLGHRMQAGGPYHLVGAVYVPSGTPRVRSHVRPPARGDDPDLYRQPGHNARHQQHGVAVEHTDGPTPASPQPVARAQPHSRDAVPPLSAESLCGPIAPATPRIRLPTQSTGSAGELVGRGVGTRHEDDICKRLRIYRKLGSRVDQRTNPSATYIGFGLSRRSSSTNYRITPEQCQRRQEALELDVQQCQRSQEAPARPTQKIKRPGHLKL